MGVRNGCIVLFGMMLHSTSCFSRIKQSYYPRPTIRPTLIKVDKTESRMCLSKECVATSHNLFKRMDLNADPCQDFNQFSCGNLIKEISIPDDKSRFSSFTPAVDTGKICYKEKTVDYHIF